jgi:hypothetical protein
MENTEKIMPPGAWTSLCCWLLRLVRYRSASGRPLVHRVLIECGVSECDREASVVRGPGPLGAVAP